MSQSVWGRPSCTGPDFSGRRFCSQVGDDGVGIEERHRAREVSAWRARRRAWSELALALCTFLLGQRRADRRRGALPLGRRGRPP